MRFFLYGILQESEEMYSDVEQVAKNFKIETYISLAKSPWIPGGL